MEPRFKGQQGTLKWKNIVEKVWSSAQGSTGKPDGGKPGQQGMEYLTTMNGIKCINR